ncbi:glycosyltransferase [Flavivirga eckloniae]|uniref:Glycosyl transferase family 1 n=1 Tax=Flavivirga eckloniae TaxID=1803846 RepID=A0A2K9PKR1_9FLAO|nr:glycosyltransferase [Flavivirga eckloniae]AUP77640.1 glycosyl transferase family 1 [Flavivirga eckloniae]
MKLAIVTAYPKSNITLNEYAYHLVKHFRQREDITELVLLTDTTTDGKKDIEFTESGCKITIKECWSFNSYKNVFSVTRAINKTKPDSILFNLQFTKFGNKKVAAALGLMLPLICKLKNIPSIALLHNTFDEVGLDNKKFANSKLMKKINGFIGKTLTRLVLQADVVAVTMKKHVKYLKSEYNAENIELIPHGTFEILEEPSFDIPLQPFKVLAFGKFGTCKKVETLIQAVEKIKAYSNLNLELVIAGTDNPSTPGYLEMVKKAYGHIEGLTFTGYVEEKDVPKLFMESSLIVLPYTEANGSSGVLHQAGGYAKAVAIPNLGDLPHLVNEAGYRCEFFEPKSICSLALAIQKILENNSYRAELERANYKAATAYPMSRITNMYVNTFQSIILKKKKEKLQEQQAIA